MATAVFTKDVALRPGKNALMRCAGDGVRAAHCGQTPRFRRTSAKTQAEISRRKFLPQSMCRREGGRETGFFIQRR
jgi:hypothetical protein